VLTVRDEKPVGPGIGERLAAALAQGGLDAVARDVQAGGRSIGAALQEAAAEAGAGMLVMGGFGHSRFRDLILGGATKGVLTDLRMPVLLSH
jgi:nucleotide-binding universal stress UspA family protein